MDTTTEGVASGGASPAFAVVDPGHCYDLMPFGGEGIHQRINFFKRVPKEEGSTELVTEYPGTTNEAMLLVLINRLEYLNDKRQSIYNERAVNHLRDALKELEMRTQERTERGVEGTDQE